MCVATFCKSKTDKDILFLFSYLRSHKQKNVSAGAERVHDMMTCGDGCSTYMILDLIRIYLFTHGTNQRKVCPNVAAVSHDNTAAEGKI
jgi:hypothetical protein